MRALFPRFLELERTDGSVIRGLRRLRRDRGGSSTAPFMSIDGGTENLVNVLVASLPRESLVSNVAVRGLEKRSEWRVHLADGTRVDGAAVLLATPPPRASRSSTWPVRRRGGHSRRGIGRLHRRCANAGDCCRANHAANFATAVNSGLNA